MKKISNIFILLAIILSYVMCIVVAYNYGNMQHSWGSAPAEVAFLYVIPYGIGILVCMIIAMAFRKKESNAIKND